LFIFDLWITSLRTGFYSCGQLQARLLRLIEIMDHTEDAQIQSQAVQCKTVAGQSGNGTGFCLSTFCVPCQLDQRVRVGSLPTGQCLFGDPGVLGRNVLPCCLVNDSVNYGIMNSYDR
jgi:hypothetical protein